MIAKSSSITRGCKGFSILAALLTTLLLIVACGSTTNTPQATEAPAATEAPTEVVESTVAATEVVTTETPAEAAEPTVALTETATVTTSTELTSTDAMTDATSAEGTVTESNPDPVLEGLPAVALDAAEAQEARGRVIAPAGVNVRTGPGINYEILGAVPLGTEGEIVGISEDGAWWVAHVPTAPNQQGWVAAAYVEATNADNVPVIATPPLPLAPVAAVMPAAATPVPVPNSLNPSGLILFSASRRLRDGNRAYELEDVYAVSSAPGSTAQLIIQNAMEPALQRNGEILAFRSTQADKLGLGGQDFGIDQRLRFSVNLEDSTPRWSPSGDRLVFSSNRTGDRRWRVYTVAAVPGNDRVGFSQLTNLGFGKDADWHPSQDLIVFKGCDKTGQNCGLWTMNADGSGRSALTDGFNDSMPRWSPNGASVVFMSDSRDGNWELYSLTVADGAVTRLTDNAASDGLPAWSPNGSQIAFMSNRNGAWGIWVIAAGGGEAQLITQLEEQLPDWLIQGLDWPR